MNCTSYMVAFSTMSWFNQHLLLYIQLLISLGRCLILKVRFRIWSRKLFDPFDPLIEIDHLKCGASFYHSSTCFQFRTALWKETVLCGQFSPIWMDSFFFFYIQTFDARINPWCCYPSWFLKDLIRCSSRNRQSISENVVATYLTWLYNCNCELIVIKL